MKKTHFQIIHCFCLVSIMFSKFPLPQIPACFLSLNRIFWVDHQCFNIFIIGMFNVNITNNFLLDSRTFQGKSWGKPGYKKAQSKDQTKNFWGNFTVFFVFSILALFYAVAWCGQNGHIVHPLTFTCESGWFWENISFLTCLKVFIFCFWAVDDPITDLFFFKEGCFSCVGVCFITGYWESCLFGEPSSLPTEN